MALYDPITDCYLQPEHVAWIDWLAIGNGDLTSVLALDAESDCPWSESAFIAHLHHGGYCMVARAADGDVIGFLLYWLDREAFHVDKVAVHPAFRRGKVGSKLLGKLIELISDRRATRNAILLTVPETNLDAQQWLKACGFRAVQVLNGIDPGTESAYLFERRAMPADVVRRVIAEVA